MKIAKFIAIDPKTGNRCPSKWEVEFHLLQPKQVIPNFSGKEDFVARKTASIITHVKDVHGVRNEECDAASPWVWEYIRSLRAQCTPKNAFYGELQERDPECGFKLPPPAATPDE